MSASKILLVEDDQNFGDVLKSYLEMHDYDVTLASDGVMGLETYRKGSFDLCIFDVMMPRKDGFTLAREVREKDKEMPIIFLTAKNLKEDILSKPFNSEELLLRIQAILRRVNKGVEKEDDIKEYQIGEYIFNYPLRILTWQGGSGNEREKLSPKEAHLLKMFCQHKNDVLTRAEALAKIWGEDNYFTARSMDVFVTKLRKYLSKDDNLQIMNIHGNGFRLIEKDQVDM